MIAVVLGLARRVPILVWVVVVALAWGAYQRHNAKAATNKLRDAEVIALKDERDTALRNAAIYQGRIEAQQGEINAAQAAASAAQRDRQSALDANGRLQRAAVNLKASAAARDTATPGSCAATTDAARVFADVLGRVAEAGGRMAAIADDRGRAGAACERLYESLQVRP